MAESISVKTDFEEVQEMFGRLVKERVKVQRAILTGIGSTSRTKVRTAYKRHLNMRSGNLYRSISYKVSKRGERLLIGTPARSPVNSQGHAVYYGSLLTKGYTLTPKTAKVLKFDINGKWITKHSIVIPSRDFVEGPVRSYIKSPAYDKRIDKILQREIDKLEKKGYRISHEV